MSRRYQPDGTLLLTAVVGRIDALEQATAKTTTDVAAIGRGLGDLTGQIRRLTTSSTGTGTGAGTGAGVPAGPGAGSSSGTTSAADEDAPQWDWFAVEDPAEAAGLIAAVEHFTTTVACHYGLVLTPACWVLHPTVIGDVLSLMAEHETAYTGPVPTPVSEWLTRWLPAGLDRIRAALNDCATERGHRHAGRTYDLTRFDAHSVPAWWATDRNVSPVEAFALTPLP